MAQLYLGILRTMGGYTLTSLKNEDPELLKLLYIEHLGSRNSRNDPIGEIQQ